MGFASGTVAVVCFCPFFIIGFLPCFCFYTVLPLTTGGILVYISEYHYVCRCDWVKQDYAFLKCSGSSSCPNDWTDCYITVKDGYNEDRLCIDDDKYKEYMFYSDQEKKKYSSLYAFGGILVILGIVGSCINVLLFIAHMTNAVLVTLGIPC